MTDFQTSVFRPLVLGLCSRPSFRRLATQTRPGRAVATRFVAGETLDDAVRVARELDRRRTASMLDLLGENALGAEQAVVARDAYLAALARIRAESTLDCAISIKLTQLGLDTSAAECLSNVQPILEAAVDTGTFVMIDMESHPYVEGTLEVLREAHARHPKVGVCLQAYLRRTEEDIFSLPAGVRVRLVKGAYLEPPDVVYQEKQDVDAAYARLFTTLVIAGPLDRCGDPRPGTSRRGARAGGLDRQRLVTGGVPDAVRCPAGPSGAAGGTGLSAPGVRPVRHRVVPLPHTPAGRTSREHVVLLVQRGTRRAGRRELNG